MDILKRCIGGLVSILKNCTKSIENAKKIAKKCYFFDFLLNFDKFRQRIAKNNLTTAVIAVVNMLK